MNLKVTKSHQNTSFLSFSNSFGYKNVYIFDKIACCMCYLLSGQPAVCNQQLHVCVCECACLLCAPICVLHM